jgi:hypothetical protein
VPERRLSADPAAARANRGFNFTLTTFDSYDWADYGTTLPALDAVAARQAGQQPGLSGRISANRSTDESSITFAAGASTDYFRFADKMMTDAYATAGQSTTVGRRTTIGATQNFSYAPYYSLGALAGPGASGFSFSAPSVPSSGLALNSDPIYRAGVGGNLSHPLTEATDLSLRYGLQLSRVNTGSDANYQDASVQFAHRASRDVGFTIGYALTYGTYAGAPDPVRIHRVDFGTNFTRRTSPTRRTVFTFGGGSAMAEPYRAGASEQLTARQVRLVGHADLNHYFNRTWSARVSYQRDWEQFEGAAAPIFRDSVNAALGGMLSSRVSATVNGAYLLGDGERGLGGAREHAYTGSAWLQVALSRTVSIFGQYAYYQHQFDSQRTELNLPAQFERSNVRAGLVLLLPPAR